MRLAIKTGFATDNIQFSYQLKPGVNKTRIGRKIAKNRGMLKN